MLSSKDEVAQKIKDYHAQITTKYNARIVYFRSDNGGEYTLRSLANFFAPLGITHEFSVPDSHQQNGVAERWNQTIYTMARCARLHFNVCEYFWPYAIRYAVHVYNRTPHSSLPYPPSSGSQLMTPYEALKGTKPNISYFVEFGAPATSRILDPTTKLGERGQLGRIMGYAPESKGYYFWNGSNMTVRRDVVVIHGTRPGEVLQGDTRTVDYPTSNQVNKPTIYAHI
jgi:hypothetical protein